jgi:hypothetical protein
MTAKQRYAQVDTVDTESAFSNTAEMANFCGVGGRIAALRPPWKKKIGARLALNAPDI